MSQPARPTLDIVIVTAPGCWPYLRACLESLSAHPASAATQRVTVVDNASGDRTSEVVAAFPEMSWVELDRNAGFSVASNVVLRTSTSDFVLLLNPDTEVQPGALDACLARFAADDRIGIVGCRLFDRMGRPDPNAKRTLPTRPAALRRLTFVDRLLGASSYHTPELGFQESGPVGAVSGAFMMVRRAVVDTVGALDEGFWMYGEDLDYSARASKAGWVVWYEGAAATMHVKGGATGQARTIRTTVAFHQAMGRYYRRHLDSERPIDLAVYGGIGVRLIGALGLAAAAGVVERLRRQLRGSAEV